MRQPLFRILRVVGSRRIDIPHPLQRDTDGHYQHAADADEAVAKARQFGASGNLIAIPESN